jgi:chloramphenicol-sensitive protein RarD
LNQGHYFAIGAFGIWGLITIFWNQFGEIAAPELLAHRVIWCFLFVSSLLFYRKGLAWITKLVSQPKVIGWLTLSSILIGINWFLFIWAVTNEHIVETSLGYFINPLVKMLLGAVLFKETLSKPQWAAVGIVAIAVSFLTYSHGSLPWIALTLAMSFALYGAIRKTVEIGASEGVAFENFVFVPVAIGYLIWLSSNGGNNFGIDQPQITFLMVLSGLITAVPLILFAKAARLIPLSTVGIIQFLAPSIQLVVGVTLYNEPFKQVEMIGFGLIWLAVAIYMLDAVRRRETLPA